MSRLFNSPNTSSMRVYESIIHTAKCNHQRDDDNDDDDAPQLETNHQMIIPNLKLNNLGKIYKAKMKTFPMDIVVELASDVLGSIWFYWDHVLPD